MMRPWPNVNISNENGLVKRLQPQQGETMMGAAKAYIDFLYDSEEHDRALAAQKENYEAEIEENVG